MDRNEAFKQEVFDNIIAQGENKSLKQQSIDWLIHSCKNNYSYNFTYLGRPVIQYPQDILVIQELIWRIQPDLIIQTGIAHGGFLIMAAATLELLNQDGEVLGIDIDIRAHNKTEILAHPMAKRIQMLEGSSIDTSIVEQVHAKARNKKNVMVILDSLHTHEHVYQELLNYSPLVTRGNYLIVLDTIIEWMPEDHFPNRPWGVGNNPLTATKQFLSENRRFIIDEQIDHQLLISVGLQGYLQCIA